MPAIVSPPQGPILVVAAHPDDIERWCAGTIALAAAAGATVTIALVTSGEHGTSDPTESPQRVAARREQEARIAAAILGAAEIVFLRHPDGHVENSAALAETLVALIRRVRPFAVFTHDPEHPLPPYLAHRDHRRTGRAVLDAIYPLARDPLSYPDQVSAGLAPHAVREVWLFASAAADCFVDIAPALERKIAARLAHASQTPRPEDLPERWRLFAARDGAPAALLAGEAFTRLVID
ncbi:MAG: PIG-L deacetylase family protein [Chloroflexota bacterium]|nr:PIG-L family deacetylase [Dehalococcoidia bacterium]MDW8253699.1 PIG-L deacetylase family protein [Chloroflexota bacterium]